MSPKIISVEKTEKNGIVEIRRIVKDEILGTIEQLLIITPQEVSLRKWYGRHYGETTLKRVKLSKQYKGIDVILTLTRGFEGEGNNWWRSVDIVPRSNEDVDKLLGKIKDFDTYADVLSCLQNTCRDMSYINVVECDVSACI